MGKSGDTAEAWRFGAPVAGYPGRAPEPQANLILMHGLGEYAHRYVDQYSALIPSLNAAGISVFAFDLHGHGASPGPRAATLSFQPSLVTNPRAGSLRSASPLSRLVSDSR